MGDCKDQLTPSKDVKPDTTKRSVKDVLGIFPKRNKDTKEATATNFADLVASADTTLAQMIITKRAELAAEKGQEDYNRKALGILETMGFHLDAVANLGSDYHELRK